jgi:hypothetical protein
LGVGASEFQYGEVHELFFTVVVRVIFFCELIEVHAFLLTVTIEVVLVTVLPRDVVEFDGIEVGRLLILLLAEDLERSVGGLCSLLARGCTHVKVDVGWVSVRLNTRRHLGVLLRLVFLELCKVYREVLTQREVHRVLTEVGEHRLG